MNDYYSGMPLKGHLGYIFIMKDCIMEDCLGDKPTVLAAYIPKTPYYKKIPNVFCLTGAPLYSSCDIIRVKFAGII